MRHYFIQATVVASLVLSAQAQAETAPLWEAGIGVGGFTFPDYKGANHQSGYALPFPYIVYRGEYIKADRDGMRAILFDNDKLDVNLSLAASLPVNSSDNTARAGMPNLRPSLEIGPSINYNLWRSQNRNLKLDIRIPVRAAFTLESRPQYIGWVATPNLNLDIKNLAGYKDLKLGLHIGPNFADNRNAAYTYSVDNAYANAVRPAYIAKGGYAGTQVTAALSKRFGAYWFGAFARYDNLSGAKFVDSPLVIRKQAYSAGLAFAWVFGASSKQVEISE